MPIPKLWIFQLLYHGNLFTNTTRRDTLESGRNLISDFWLYFSQDRMIEVLTPDIYEAQCLAFRQGATGTKVLVY